MRPYHQLTSEERYELSALRKQGFSQAYIARALGRHPSTISREVRRNSREDGGYRPGTADDFARWRRARSRRNSQFTAADWELVTACLKEDWSPEQIAGRLKRDGLLSISHETIYRFVWQDRRYGGSLHNHLRQRSKTRRKRYGGYDSRGRLAGKRPISDRPPGAENRSRVGHFEGDTIMGSSNDSHCLLILVDRKTGYTLAGKLSSRTVAATNRRAKTLIRRSPRSVRTLTVDHGTEFHGYKDIEQATDVRFYFATPYHSWERGTSENTNGLFRQYFPKRQSLAHVSQRHCSKIAAKLNRRPRKRLNYLTPEECFVLRTSP